jgi:hypothetical protein
MGTCKVRNPLSKEGTYKVRNEMETKRNETKPNEAKRNQTKRNETERNETKCNVVSFRK